MISQTTLSRRLAAWSVVVAILLLVPLLARAPWTLLDFVFMGTLLFSAAMIYELVAGKGGAVAYRVAVGVAVATGLVLVWINAAVGIIGDGPVNLLYLGVVAVGFLGIAIARFQPRGMALTCFAMAIAQMLVPVLALLIWNPPFDPGIGPVFALNAVFAALWIASATLFLRAAPPPKSQPGR